MCEQIYCVFRTHICLLILSSHLILERDNKATPNVNTYFLRYFIHLHKNVTLRLRRYHIECVKCYDSEQVGRNNADYDIKFTWMWNHLNVGTIPVAYGLFY